MRERSIFAIQAEQSKQTAALRPYQMMLDSAQGEALERMAQMIDDMKAEVGRVTGVTEEMMAAGLVGNRSL